MISSSSSTTAEETEICLNSIYCFNPGKPLGQGGFGQIYIGENTQTHEPIAVKTEQVVKKSYLQIEYDILTVLQGSPGVPTVYQFFKSEDRNYLVMEALGRSIEQIFILHKQTFSLKTIIQIALQMIDRIEYLHLKGFIHRDIKPGNFTIGRGEFKDVIYMIDFGLSKRYREGINNAHIAYKDGKGLTGTSRYASLFTHYGIEQSRRDDIEGMGYNLVFLLKGSLPWQSVRAKNKKEKNKKVMEMKKEISLDELCSGFPKEFKMLIQYARGLNFEEKPDYNGIRIMFAKLMHVNKFELDNKFDWSDEDVDELECRVKEMKKKQNMK